MKEAVLKEIRKAFIRSAHRDRNDNLSVNLDALEIELKNPGYHDKLRKESQERKTFCKECGSPLKD